jgi:hypothetical protein
VPQEFRLYLSSECRDLADAECCALRSSTRSKVIEIQNEGLCDLNDEINKLLCENGHWERRFVELDISLSIPVPINR